MATDYVDPGSYTQRKTEPGSVSVSSSRNLAIVAIAPRTKRVTDEAVVRGKVYEEALSGFPAVTPFIDTLVNVCDRDRNNVKLYADGNELGLGDWSFDPAKITGNAVAGAAVDTTTKKKFTLSLDRRAPITVDLTSGAGTTLITIAVDINAALLASPIYGAAYSAVVTTITGGAPNDTLVITSPLTTSSSDVKVFLSYEDDAVTYQDASSIISNAAWVPLSTAGYQSPTVVRIVDAVFSATTTYTIDYITVGTVEDPLSAIAVATPLDSISNVGTYPGGSNYTKDSDYEKNGNNVDWDTTYWTNATLTGINGPYAIIATNDALLISINGGAQLTVPLTNGAAQTAANIAEDINLALNASSNYGPLYAHCAYVSGTAVAMVVPRPFENYPTNVGESSVIEFFAVANNGFTTLFGVPAASLPYEVLGTGVRPDFATTYYTTYDHTRDSDDYDTYHKVYSPEDLYEYTSPLTLSNYPRNKLAIAGEIVFEQEAPSCILVQINDSTVPGTPSSAQIRAAIDVCKKTAEITDVVVIDTSLGAATYLQNHVSNMSTQAEKKPRRGWYGMARGTDPGDPDTPDTFIYRSKVTLQPGGTSPGRGRQILVAPSEMDRIITLEDEREITLELDSSYAATAAAAHFTALGNPSDAMVGDELVGFEVDDFETYEDEERKELADSGVLVVTMVGGRALMLDPLTTEAGGGKVVGFEEPQASSADDAVTNTINTLLDRNVKGVTPDDLADFLSDVKSWIKLGLEASIEAKYIAPYRNADNTTRRLDPVSDINVVQSASDPRTFRFKYWYNRRYPAKRFFGEYSVDNPFFSGTA